MSDIFQFIFVLDNFLFILKFHQSVFFKVQLTISKHWFWWWLGTEQAKSLLMMIQFSNAFMGHYVCMS